MPLVDDRPKRGLVDDRPKPLDQYTTDDKIKLAAASGPALLETGKAIVGPALKNLPFALGGEAAAIMATPALAARFGGGAAINAMRHGAVSGGTMAGAQTAGDTLVQEGRINPQKTLENTTIGAGAGMLAGAVPSVLKAGKDLVTQTIPTKLSNIFAKTPQKIANVQFNQGNRSIGDIILDNGYSGSPQDVYGEVAQDLKTLEAQRFNLLHRRAQEAVTPKVPDVEVPSNLKLTYNPGTVTEVKPERLRPTLPTGRQEKAQNIILEPTSTQQPGGKTYDTLAASGRPMDYTGVTPGPIEPTPPSNLDEMARSVTPQESVAGDAFKKGPNIDLRETIQSLDDLLAQKGRINMDPQTIFQLKMMREGFLANKPQYQTISQADALLQDLDNEIRGAWEQSGDVRGSAVVNAAKAIASRLRDQLAKVDPELAAIRAKLHDLMMVERTLAPQMGESGIQRVDPGWIRDIAQRTAGTRVGLGVAGALRGPVNKAASFVKPEVEMASDAGRVGLVEMLNKRKR